jgi:branched-chain amino acid transport system permease protein
LLYRSIVQATGLLARLPSGRGARIATLVFFAFVILTTVAVPLSGNSFYLELFTTIAMFVCLAQAWNLMGGLTGYAAFGNVVFFGLGAYTTAVAVTNAHLPFGVGILLGILLATAFAVLIGLPILRLRGHYFAIATLGVAEAIRQLFTNVDAFGLGGAVGITLPFRRYDRALFFWLMVAAMVLATVIVSGVLRSRFGYALLAIRENEEAARVMGIHTTPYKVAAFALSAGLTALAGGIYALWHGFISPDPDSVFSIDFTLQMILSAVLGGAGTVIGPIIGAYVLQIVIDFLQQSVHHLSGIFLGLTLALVILFLPRGLADFLGGHSRFSLRFFRDALRETGI